MKGKDRIIVALDVPTLGRAKELAGALRGHVGAFKVGLELCTAAGVPQVVEAVGEDGFLDLKFTGIPNTVAGAAAAAARLGIKMFNVYSLGGGAKMMRATMES